MTSIWLLCLCAAALSQGNPRLVHDLDAGETGRVEAQGLSNEQLEQLRRYQQAGGDLAALMPVYVGEATERQRQPMLGEYSLTENTLRFEPRFPLRRGLTYSMTLRMPEQKAPLVTRQFRIPAGEPMPPAEVAQVYPSRSALPENLLKFYLHFSAPMARGDAYQHLRLLDLNGKPIDLPFLELGEELWNDTGMRLTVFFDPGRIKRGLKPREEEGPVLEEGKSYTLVVLQNWRDASGRPLKTEFRKRFRVMAPDERQPDIKRWRITAPKPGTTERLSVEFDEPLDHAMLHRVLQVRDSAGEQIPGEVFVDREETRWQFRPKQPWRKGAYRLVADATLEDLAGNSLGRPFEIDVFHPIERSVAQETMEAAFEVE